MGAVVDATARLTASLRAVSAALATPDAVGLLAAEPALVQALTDLRNVTSLSSAQRPAVLAELSRARTELARCRTLGASARDVTDLLLATLGHARYDGSGGTMAPPAQRGAQIKAAL